MSHENRPATSMKAGHQTGKWMVIWLVAAITFVFGLGAGAYSAVKENMPEKKTPPPNP